MIVDPIRRWSLGLAAFLMVFAPLSAEAQNNYAQQQWQQQQQMQRQQEMMRQQQMQQQRQMEMQRQMQQRQQQMMQQQQQAQRMQQRQNGVQRYQMPGAQRQPQNYPGSQRYNQQRNFPAAQPNPNRFNVFRNPQNANRRNTDGFQRQPANQNRGFQVFRSPQQRLSQTGSQRVQPAATGGFRVFRDPRQVQRRPSIWRRSPSGQKSWLNFPSRQKQGAVRASADGRIDYQGRHTPSREQDVTTSQKSKWYLPWSNKQSTGNIKPLNGSRIFQGGGNGKPPSYPYSANDNIRISKTERGHILKTIENAKRAEGKKLLLGSYPHYLAAAKVSNSRVFLIPKEVWATKVLELKKRGFNDKEIQLRMFASHNKKTLDRAIKRNERIFISTPRNKIDRDSYLQMEINYLTSKGYNFSADGTELVKGN